MHQRAFFLAFFSLVIAAAAAAAAAFVPRAIPSSHTSTNISSTTALPPFDNSRPLLNSTTATDPQEPQCFHQGEISHRMQPIALDHCYQLLTHLVARFSASPVPWNTPDYPVPKLWTWGTCMISFEKKSAGAWDVFSELQVAKAVAGTIVECVKAETGWLGGRVSAGPRMQFVVSVFGRGTPLQDIGTS